jgi:hypothetical protein
LWPSTWCWALRINLFGEEKAMLEVSERGEAMPREADRPPYVRGLFVTGLDRSQVENIVSTVGATHQ